MVGQVAIVGAGTMGSGIAQVAAAAGHDVVVIDLDRKGLDRGEKALTGSLASLVKRGRMSATDAGALAARVTWRTDIGAAKDADLIVEAIVEQIDIKRSLFADLAMLVHAKTVLASNTSSISISAMAEGLPHPERFVGLHFFNPVPAMKLVEVVAGASTDPALVERLTGLMQRWGKHAVAVRDVPGFIVNRIARPYYAEAFIALGEGVAPATIDAALTGGGGFPMGPLALADLIGHDINYAVATSVFEGMQPHTRFRPQPAQARLVEQGLLGRKADRGVYDYPINPPAAEDIASEPATRIDIAPDAHAFLWMQHSTDCVANDILPTGTIWVDGVAMAYGDGRPLSQRQDVDALLDHIANPIASAVLVATARDARATRAVERLAATLGKRPLLVPDRPGQIVLRTLAQLANGAFDAIDDGIATPSSIDEAMIYGANYPQGPIAWARDFGLADLARVLSNIATATGDALYVPSKGLRPAMSGSQARTIADLLKTRETMGANWGIEIEDVRPGYARISVTISESMLNGYDMAHGGALFTLADQAFAYACNSHNALTVGQSATIDFLSPAKAGERVVTEAQEIMKSGRSGTYLVTVRSADGRDIASFHGLSRTIGGTIIDLESGHA